MTIPFTNFVLRFGELAVTQLWQVTLLAIVVGLIVRTCCRHRPHLAYLLWMIVILKCLTPPVLSSPTSPFSWLDTFLHAEAVATSTVAMTPVTRSLPTFAAVTDDDSEINAPRTKQAPILPPTSTINLLELVAVALAIVWLAGIGVFTARSAIKLQNLRRMRRTEIELPARLQDQVVRLSQSLEIRQKVRVAVVREQVRPAVFGFFRPTILLPATLVETASREIMEPILAHELIHVRRGDTLVATLQLVAQILWWFHPLVWWANRELRRERERACDEEVVAELKCSPVSYARLLLNLLESLPAQPAKLSAASVTMLSFTARRLEYLVRGKARFHRRTPRSYWLIGIVALIVVLPGASIKWSQNTPLVAKASEK